MNNEWILCSERQPEKYEEYLVTWTGVLGGIRQSPFLWMTEYESGNWITSDLEKRGYKDIEVVAWQPLPDPYVEEQE